MIVWWAEKLAGLGSSDYASQKFRVFGSSILMQLERYQYFPKSLCMQMQPKQQHDLLWLIYIDAFSANAPRLWGKIAMKQHNEQPEKSLQTLITVKTVICPLPWLARECCFVKPNLFLLLTTILLLHCLTFDLVIIHVV